MENIGSVNQTQVQARTLDQLMEGRMIDLMKVDVEGHELEVLKGAESLLDAKFIKHILFEDFGGADSEVIRFLMSKGYEVFRLTKGFFNIKIVDLLESDQIPLWEPPNFIATTNIKKLMKSDSYQLLK